MQLFQQLLQPDLSPGCFTEKGKRSHTGQADCEGPHEPEPPQPRGGELWLLRCLCPFPPTFPPLLRRKACCSTRQTAKHGNGNDKGKSNPPRGRDSPPPRPKAGQDARGPPAMSARGGGEAGGAILVKDRRGCCGRALCKGGRAKNRLKIGSFGVATVIKVV